METTPERILSRDEKFWGEKSRGRRQRFVATGGLVLPVVKFFLAMRFHRPTGRYYCTSDASKYFSRGKPTCLHPGQRELENICNMNETWSKYLLTEPCAGIARPRTCNVENLQQRRRRQHATLPPACDVKEGMSTEEGTENGVADGLCEVAETEAPSGGQSDHGVQVLRRRRPPSRWWRCFSEKQPAWTPP
jgi:hypothetical protein